MEWTKLIPGQRFRFTTQYRNKQPVHTAVTDGTGSLRYLDSQTGRGQPFDNGDTVAVVDEMAEVHDDYVDLFVIWVYSPNGGKIAHGAGSQQASHLVDDGPEHDVSLRRFGTNEYYRFVAVRTRSTGAPLFYVTEEDAVRTGIRAA